jgi:hypothetical protein
MSENSPLSDNEADDRLKAALDALGEAPGVTAAANTALAAARKALSLLSLGLIAAGVKRELEAPRQDSLGTDGRTRSVGSLSSEIEKGPSNFLSPTQTVNDDFVSENQRSTRGCREGRRRRLRRPTA